MSLHFRLSYQRQAIIKSDFKSRPIFIGRGAKPEGSVLSLLFLNIPFRSLPSQQRREADTQPHPAFYRMSSLCGRTLTLLEEPKAHLSRRPTPSPATCKPLDPAAQARNINSSLSETYRQVQRRACGHISRRSSITHQAVLQEPGTCDPRRYQKRYV